MKCFMISNRDTTFAIELTGDELKMIVVALGNMDNADLRREMKEMEYTTRTPTEKLDSYPLYTELRTLADNHND